MKTWVCGDIHGEFEKLKSAFKNTPATHGDTIVFLGDFIDRGPDSFGVIEFINGLKRYFNVITINGNHDSEFVWGLKTGNYDFYNHGQKETLESYRKNCRPDISIYLDRTFAWVDLPVLHKSFFESLISYHLDDFGNLFVHGGINRHLLLSEQNNNIFLWDRDLLHAARSYHYSMGKIAYPFKIKDTRVKRIFVGHTPVQYFKKTKPQTYGPVTVLDLGAGKFDTGSICFYDIETNDYFVN